MKDGLARRIVKRIALFRYQLDLGFTRLFLRLRGEPSFLLHGTCRKCGACCVTPMIQVWLPFFYFPSARWAIITWHRVVNGFEFIGQDRNDRTFIFRCTHWDPDTKRCDSYESRPGMCRDYPKNLLYSFNPVFPETCGRFAVDKHAAGLRAALERLELPPDKLETLERRLHVRDPDA